MNMRNATGRTLEQIFRLREQGTTPGRELLAGVTTFLVMAYIIFVNPAILALIGVAEGKGPDFLATVTATCLVAGIRPSSLRRWRESSLPRPLLLPSSWLAS
jgi:AGZA family xanthine/uracil permease-like MFS transporter